LTPKIVVAWVCFDTSTSVRSLKRMPSKIDRLFFSETSSCVPRSVNSNTPFGTRRTAWSRRSKMLHAFSLSSAAGVSSVQRGRASWTPHVSAR